VRSEAVGRAAVNVVVGVLGAVRAGLVRPVKRVLETVSPRRRRCVDWNRPVDSLLPRIVSTTSPVFKIFFRQTAVTADPAEAIVRRAIRRLP